MNDPIVTIVVTQRERFAYSAISLESIYKNTSSPFKLIYIDGNSPPHIKRYLEVQAAQKGFKLLRTEHFLSHNKSRNLGQAQVDTKYVVFVDNDLTLTSDWLEALVECAEEMEAWVVGPVVIEGKLEDQIIHTVGEEAHFQMDRGQRNFHGPQRFAHCKLSEVQNQLRRGAVECVEFHCMLARNSIFNILGPLDEKFMGISDHQDFCLAVNAAGGAIYFEPGAVVALAL